MRRAACQYIEIVHSTSHQLLYSVCPSLNTCHQHFQPYSKITAGDPNLYSQRLANITVLIRVESVCRCGVFDQVPHQIHLQSGRSHWIQTDGLSTLTTGISLENVKMIEIGLDEKSKYSGTVHPHSY